MFNSSNTFLENFYEHINDNMDGHLSVGYLAKKMSVSKSTLNRKLQMLTGLSANEVIRQCRLQTAAMLLAEGKNVTETAYLTGFETPSYFIQRFREFYKHTPKKYAQIIAAFQALKEGDERDWLFKMKTA